MTRRSKIEVAIAVLILILLLFFLWFFLRPKAQVGGGGVDDPIVQEEETPAPPVRVSEVDSRTQDSPAEVIARSFVERLGSYSTDVDYVNVDDVKELSTASLQGVLDGAAAAARASENGSYYGVSTRVITVTSVASDATTASFLMTTQRTESIDSPGNTTTRYQDVEIELVKNGTRWLVNSYAWVD